ncbi:MAG: hypothetical protein J5651_04170 [Salinivirgaceae bacterium]|nr:hypothetical protein [Salinivirgaceae bacterium]
MKTSILTLSVFALLCAACTNDLTPDFSDMEGELTINAFLFTDRDTNYVYVSETRQIAPQPVNNATIEMRVNGTLVETVDRVAPTVKRDVKTDEGVTLYDSLSQTLNGTYQLTKRFGEGDVVRIDVYSNGRHAWAEETAPHKIRNPKADFKLANHTIYECGEQVTRTYADFTISLDDISQDAEYYRISAYADYNHTATQWMEYWSFFYQEYDNIDSVYAQHNNIDSICNELRKDYKMVVPVDFTDNDGNQKVDIYFLRNEHSQYWNPGRCIDYSYGNDPILSEGEMPKSSDEDDADFLVSNIINKHKVFADRLFNNSTAEISISVNLPFGNIFSPDKIYAYDYLEHLSEDYLLMSGTVYNMKVKLSIESINENQYYYLKALNVVESDGYVDIATLSGALKIPSNVNGGCGNICLTTNTVFEFNILDNYTRKRVVEEEPLYY